MKYKPGVVMYEIHPVLENRLPLIEWVWQEQVGEDPTITSAREGEHSPTSLHYIGRALDFRTREYSAAQVERLRADLARRLGPAFDVVVEDTHLHLEYDPR